MLGFIFQHHGLHVKYRLRILQFTSWLIWIWVKIRYPNNWMVNTKITKLD